MATVDDITKAALRLLKVNQSGEKLTPDESNDGRDALNDIIEQMNLQNYMQPAKKQLTQALTADDGTYTFGTGGDNSTRPTEIRSAYILSNNVSYPVRIISNEEYSDIGYKSIKSSYPYNLYFRAEYPLATIELYPIPSTSGSTLYLETRAALSTYTAGTDTVTLPPGYLKYLKYQLAIDISPEYKEPSPSVYANAREAKALIKRTNMKDKPTMTNTARVAVNGSGSVYLRTYP